MPVKRNLLAYRALAHAARAICTVLGRLEVSGREHIPKSGAFILAGNHLSHLDPPLLASVSPRFLSYMAKDELFQVPGIGAYLRAIGCFPVRRGTADRAALRRALETLAGGDPICMFPEGHRSDDGRLQAGEDGVGLIALRSRVPVVPGAITGTQSILPPGGTRFHFGKVRVRIGAPITFDDLYEQPGREAVSETTRRIMAAIQELLPPDYHPLREEAAERR